MALRRRNILFTISVSCFGNTMRETFQIHAFCFKLNICLLYFDRFGKLSPGNFMDNGELNFFVNKFLLF